MLAIAATVLCLQNAAVQVPHRNCCIADNTIGVDKAAAALHVERALLSAVAASASKG